MAKESALKIKDDAEAEVRTRRAEIARVEERLDNRDTALERREGELDERRRRLTETEDDISAQSKKSSGRGRPSTSKCWRRSPASPGPRPRAG